MCIGQRVITLPLFQLYLLKVMYDILLPDSFMYTYYRSYIWHFNTWQFHLYLLFPATCRHAWLVYCNLAMHWWSLSKPNDAALRYSLRLVPQCSLVLVILPITKCQLQQLCNQCQAHTIPRNVIFMTCSRASCWLILTPNTLPDLLWYLKFVVDCSLHFAACT